MICKCSGTCNHWLCRCKRIGIACNRNCNCNYSTCQNKEREITQDEMEEDDVIEVITIDSDDDSGVSTYYDLRYRYQKMEKQPSNELTCHSETVESQELQFQDVKPSTQRKKEAHAAKRTASVSTFCRCKTKSDCGTRSCGCRRREENCTLDCLCYPQVCKNRQASEDTEPAGPSQLEEVPAPVSKRNPPVSKRNPPVSIQNPLVPKRNPPVSVRNRRQRSKIHKLTVAEVSDFIQTIPGCTNYVEQFEEEEIDGEALLLLKEEHLTNRMLLKLGPALKICDRIQKISD